MVLKMGNEKSIPPGLKIQDVIKITDAWIQKSAILSNDMTKICVFEQHLKDENVQALQNLSKNLMLYRHPYILKYISSWRTNKTLYVATEFGKPLSMVFAELMPLQLCIGLLNILKAVIFLQDTALSCHNNISKDAIYVTEEGDWKLGRLELMTSKKITKALSTVKIDSNKGNSNYADQKGFAVLTNEILQNLSNGVNEFREYCKVTTSSNTFNPGFFPHLLQHKFFSHQFVHIYNFLYELPSKTESEKATMFMILANELQSFPEEAVASQLSSLLLSRLVLLNETAQEFFLPKVFTPKDDVNLCLFSVPTMKKYILPKLLNMFCIRDSQIRLILLRNFSSFQIIFNKEQLQNRILPELLVGIKDTNELLVSTTLHKLADLIPVLGASVVIGKGRAKLFADGRPLLKKESANKTLEKSKSTSSLESLQSNNFIPLGRLSPEGGEEFVDPIINHEINADNYENMVYEESTVKTMKLSKLNNSGIKVEKSTEACEKNSLLSLGVKQTLKENPNHSLLAINDLSSLDIKCSRSKNDPQLDDIELMFKDMEPIISRTEVMKISNSSEVENKENKFKVAEIQGENFDGWEDDVTDWISQED